MRKVTVRNERASGAGKALVQRLIHTLPAVIAVMSSIIEVDAQIRVPPEPPEVRVPTVRFESAIIRKNQLPISATGFGGTIDGAGRLRLVNVSVGSLVLV